MPVYFFKRSFTRWINFLIDNWMELNLGLKLTNQKDEVQCFYRPEYRYHSEGILELFSALSMRWHSHSIPTVFYKEVIIILTPTQSLKCFAFKIHLFKTKCCEHAIWSYNWSKTPFWQFYSTLYWLIYIAVTCSHSQLPSLALSGIITKQNLAMWFHG